MTWKGDREKNFQLYTLRMLFMCVLLHWKSMSTLDTFLTPIKHSLSLTLSSLSHIHTLSLFTQMQTAKHRTHLSTHSLTNTHTHTHTLPLSLTHTLDSSHSPLDWFHSCSSLQKLIGFGQRQKIMSTRFQQIGTNKRLNKT